jgi:hypothetical protein
LPERGFSILSFNNKALKIIITTVFITSFEAIGTNSDVKQIYDKLITQAKIRQDAMTSRPLGGTSMGGIGGFPGYGMDMGYRYGGGGGDGYLGFGPGLYGASMQPINAGYLPAGPAGAAATSGISQLSLPQPLGQGQPASGGSGQGSSGHGQPPPAGHE